VIDDGWVRSNPEINSYMMCFHEYYSKKKSDGLALAAASSLRFPKYLFEAYFIHYVITSPP
jgi:hypothetical protein